MGSETAANIASGVGGECLMGVRSQTEDCTML